MGRKILFITTDQMRFDALGCNGGRVARTPVIDSLAASGANYQRAHNQNVVCMPSRATMLTGQYVGTHGVWMNGVALPVDAPSVARELNRAGYRTALIGKAHFEPHVDFEGQFYENQMARRGEFGPHRGFEHMELATHSALVFHYGAWLRANHPDEVGLFYPNLTPELRVNNLAGGDTGAIQVHENPIPRAHYHTDWVADRTIAYLDSLSTEDDWFVWMSFPDPHHPWDPPASEVARVPWREIETRKANPASPEQAEKILAGKPGHWLDYYRGARVSNMEAPPNFVPASLSPDQRREIDALAHVENELIDEACGRVLARIDARGWGEDTDVIFTSDHGELQGDFGLLFKGAYHVDALMRVPLVWRPARSASLPAVPAVPWVPAVIEAPVGHVDLAATFCQIAGLAIPPWQQGRPLPQSDEAAQTQGRQRVLTEWESEFEGDSIYLRSIHRDGFTCTAYEESSLYDGNEGELYDLHEDPLQWHNLWNDPARQALKKELLADLYDHLPGDPRQPERRARLPVVAPV